MANWLMTSISRRKLLARSTAATTIMLAAPAIVRAQANALKIGVLLPRSGYMASTGQSAHRGAMIAPKVLSDYGHRVELIHIDTESNVDAARIAAQRAINEGVHCIVGNVDSGGTLAVAQVCEQRQVPLVVNVGAAPQITEQGFKFVARNFPHAGMLMEGGLRLIKNLLDVTKLDAKTAVFFYANDTFGQAQRGALDALFLRAGLPFQVTDHVAFDPRAQELSVEVTKIRASNPDIVMVVTRGNDAVKLIRDMVRQRFLPKAIISPGSSGMFEEEYYQTLGPLADYTIFHLPWANPSRRWRRRLKPRSSRRSRTTGSRWNASMSVLPSRPCWSRPTRSNGQDRRTGRSS
jgi:branched-chain amino acid transport system substrate-binding protein